jgi:Spy/CpxP family protein refolding chaperone
MSRKKIAAYLVLIFLAGAIAGGALVRSIPESFGIGGRPRHPRPSPEEFANHIWNQMKVRLQLTEDQIPKIEPIFRAGFAEVHSIQQRTVQEVEAIIRTNHQQIASYLTETQRSELESMHAERQNFLLKREGSSTNTGPNSSSR